MVPILAWSDAPSDLTRYAITTFRIAGAAPKDTVHLLYVSAVAGAVFASAPKSVSSGW